MKYLNLGCGARFHPDWTNVDFVSSSPCVSAHDLNQGVPFPDGMFDVVYHSHVLEHFPKAKAQQFLKECWRVLVRGGVIRVAVPDLERIARTYLESLERASRGQCDWEHHYDWMMLELYDQTVRTCSGGAMLKYLQRRPIPNEAFVFERLGAEARRIAQASPVSDADVRPRPSSGANIWGRISNFPATIRRVLLRVLLGQKGCDRLEVMRFRASGEIHQWMYDRFSLERLLRASGFHDPKRTSAAESRIPAWTAFNLDTEPDGSVYKPDSLYMEASKI